MASSEITELVPTEILGQVIPELKCLPSDRERLFFVDFFGLLDNLFATIKTIRCNAVSQVRFARGRIDRQR